MKIYLDESMPGDSEILLLGILVIPDNAARLLQSYVIKQLKKWKFKKEMKYANITDRFYLKAAKEIISNFSALDSALFRCVYIAFDEKSLKTYDKKKLNKVRVGLYIDVAIKLLKANIGKDIKVDIYMDKENKVEKTELKNKLLNANLNNGASVNSVTFVNSQDRIHCLTCVPDLLLGGILQNLFPSKSETKNYKREFGEFHRLLFGVEDYDRRSWKKIPLARAKQYNMKLHLSYWSVPDFNVFAQKKKSRSKHNR